MLDRFSAYHHSHPTLMERLRAMEEFENKRERGRRSFKAMYGFGRSEKAEDASVDARMLEPNPTSPTYEKRMPHP